jgi:YVTN family beta-propeller protein
VTYAGPQSGAVIPVSTATNHARRPIQVAGGAVEIAIAPNGRTAYVSALSADSVIPISTATNAPGAAIRVGQRPEGIAITPDGKTAYVANDGSGTVTAINTTTTTNTAEKTIKVGGAPGAIVITP